MLSSLVWVHQGLFHQASDSMRMHSSGLVRRGVLAKGVAVLTGSTKEIDLTIACRLAKDGAHVVIRSQRQHNVDCAVAMLQGEGLSVGKAEDLQQLVAKDSLLQALESCGGMDVLVCNAGVTPLVGSILGGQQVWDKILNVSVNAKPVAALHGEERELGACDVSKTAPLDLTRTLALELASKNI